MHVGFEAKRFFTNFTGLGNYSRFVISALSQYYPENTYTLFSPKVRSHREYDDILRSSNVEAVGPEGLFRLFPGLWRAYGVSKTASAKNLDIFHGLSQELPSGLPARAAKVVTVHDLIFMRYPQYYNPADVAIYKAKVASACRRANKVIAISRQTADDVAAFLGTPRDKISVVYQGCHPSFRERKSEDQKNHIRQKYALPDRYILNVGTIEERKNLGVLIDALPLITDREITLVVVGRATKYKEKILSNAKRLKVENRIRFLHDVSFADLPGIYQMCNVFVYPSRFEGFGIPLLEAIECGVPVISSTGSCFQEAAGPHSLYADPSDCAQLAKHIENTLTDQTLRKDMVGRSAEFAVRFRPEVIAGDLIREYSLLLK